MSQKITTLRPLALVLILVLVLLAHYQTAYPRTRVEVGPGRCTVTITIPIEIHGPSATQELADRWKRNIERTWNGPTAELAEQIANENGLDLRGDRAEINRLAREYLDQAGVGSDCSYVNCCTICFVADVRLRGDSATPGYHQVEAVPELDDEGNWNRPYVNHNRVNGGEWGLNGQRGSTTGRWDDNTDWPAEAHETGHLMGLDDQYTDVPVTDPETGDPVTDPDTGEPVTRSVPNDGHGHDIMANNLAWPFEGAITEILEKGLVRCDCCESADDAYVSYGRTFRPATDAIFACNLDVLRQALADYEDQRRNLPYLRLPLADKHDLSKKLDEIIERIRRAIEECQRREPTTTGVIPGGEGITFDGGEWCTYWGWETPPISIPPVTPPTVPPTRPPERPPTITPPPVTVPPEEEEVPPTVPPPTVPPEEEIPPTVPPPTVPPEEEEEEIPPTAPPTIVKAKVTDQNTGQAVTGCQLKFSFAPPELPLPGAPREDRGYSEDPSQGISGPDGTATLVAGGAPPEFQDGGKPVGEPVEIEVELPSFKSYIVKVNIDKTKKNRDDPASYFDPIINSMIVRHWVVGDSIYAVINVPAIKEK